MESITMGLKLWPKVRARVATLRAWERPLAAEIPDERVVEFGRRGRGARYPQVIGDYKPLGELDLLGAFIHVFGRDRVPSDAEVKQFYAEFGPLLSQREPAAETLPPWAHRLDVHTQERLARERLLHCREPLWWVREQARELAIAYDLYMGLRDRDLAALRAVLGPVPIGRRITHMSIVYGRVVRDTREEEEKTKRRGSAALEVREEVEAGLGPELRPLTAEEAIGWANKLLAQRLSQAQVEYRWEHLVVARRTEGTGGDEPRLPGALAVVRLALPRLLLDAMYVQLGGLVAGDTTLHTCPGCGRPFRPRRRNHRWCTIQCADRTRQRGYYAEAPRGRKKKRRKKRRQR